MDGDICLPWTLYNQEFLHKLDFHANIDGFNYCRNPNNNIYGPWCYIDSNVGGSKKWLKSHNMSAHKIIVKTKLCSLPICGLSKEKNKIYMENTDKTIVETNCLKSADKIKTFVFPITILCGTVSNCFALKVFTRPALIKSTTTFLLIVLSTTDLLSLYLGAFPRWLRGLTDWYLEARNDTFCKTAIYVYYIVISFNSWVIVSITYERVYLLVYPVKAKLVGTKQNATKLMLCVFISLCFLNIPKVLVNVAVKYIVFDANEVDFRLIASCGGVGKHYFKRWLDAITRCLIPFILILVGNIIVIIKICERKHKLLGLNKSKSKKTEENDLTLISTILLTATFLHLLLSLPYLLYALFNKYTRNLYESFDHFYSCNKLWYVISVSFMYVSNGLNFPMYCIGGKMFKDEFIKMLKCMNPQTNIISPLDTNQNNRGNTKMSTINRKITMKRDRTTDDDIEIRKK